MNQPRRASVARTVELLADHWSFLVMREAFFGVRRFQDFQLRLGIPRGTLAARLASLMRDGIFGRERYSTRPDRYAYRLTDKGMDLYPSLVALMGWGDRWLSGGAPPLALFHRPCGHWTEPRVTCSHCHGPVRPQRVRYRTGPGQGPPASAPGARQRRASDAAPFAHGRACSIAATLRIIGDRWSFRVIREGFFGVRRFDAMRANLGIAPNILSDRLQRLVEDGIFDRVRYQDRPERFEYRFTDKGRDLYGSMIVMGRWGDRWLSPDGPALLLHHVDCGHDFEPEVTCSGCGAPLHARDMGWADATAGRPAGPPQARRITPPDSDRPGG